MKKYYIFTDSETSQSQIKKLIQDITNGFNPTSSNKLEESLKFAVFTNKKDAINFKNKKIKSIEKNLKIGHKQSHVYNYELLNKTKSYNLKQVCINLTIS